jgi:hypothetical protein
MLGFILRQLVNINTQKDHIGLSSPYFTFEDSVRHTLKEFLGAKSSPFDDITFQNSSYFAKSVLLLLVRTNLKVTSKSIWPTFSKLSLKHFSPEKQWGFCLLRTAKGINVTDLPKLTKHWKELQQEARDCRCPEAPEEFVENRYLLMLFCILFPYRAIPSVVSKLDRYFNGSWFIPEEPIEDL